MLHGSTMVRNVAPMSLLCVQHNKMTNFPIGNSFIGVAFLRPKFKCTKFACITYTIQSSMRKYGSSRSGLRLKLQTRTANCTDPVVNAIVSVSADISLGWAQHCNHIGTKYHCNHLWSTKPLGIALWGIIGNYSKETSYSLSLNRPPVRVAGTTLAVCCPPHPSVFSNPPCETVEQKKRSQTLPFVNLPNTLYNNNSCLFVIYYPLSP